MSRIYKYLLVAVLMSVGQLVFAQMRSVKGTVTDEANLPLPGTSVIVSGTQRGVVTDEKGNYEITASSDESLEFDFMGYSHEIDTDLHISSILTNANRLLPE